MRVVKSPVAPKTTIEHGLAIPYVKQDSGRMSCSMGRMNHPVVGETPSQIEVYQIGYFPVG